MGTIPRVRPALYENAIYWLENFTLTVSLGCHSGNSGRLGKHADPEITEETQKRGGWIICEDPRNDRRIVTPREKKADTLDAVWADDFHNVGRGAVTGEK